MLRLRNPMDEKETQKAKARSMRTGAEFIMADIKLAFTFLDVARASTAPVQQSAIEKMHV
jgi:hypothetical protein